MKPQAFAACGLAAMGALCVPFLAASARSGADTASGLASGPTVRGLQLSISVAGGGKGAKASEPEFEVTLRNRGEADASVSLGMMLAGNKVQMPNSLRMEIADAAGHKSALGYFDRKYPGIRGRVDDYIVPLRAGSAYTLRLRAQNLWASNSGSLKLEPGRYKAAAILRAGGARYINQDTKGIGAMPLWEGTLRSNEVALEVS